MLKKILMAAGFVAAFTLSAQAAEVTVRLKGYGDHGYCNKYNDPYRCGGYDNYDNYGNYPRLRLRDPYPAIYDDPYPLIYDHISCKEARWIVRERGFRDVRTTSCGGKYHVFIAKKRSGIFKVRVYSRNGQIHSIRPI